jgi:hypothetical protein
LRLAAAWLAFVPAVASALMGDMPVSICNLQPPLEGRELHIRARFVGHAQGAVLADPECPGRTLLVKDLSPLSKFTKEVDPGGQRFGPLGEGTHVDVEISGRIHDERQVAVSSVSAYTRIDVIDSRWRVESIENWVSQGNWAADEQFPFTANPRKLKSASHFTTVHGKLGDEDVGVLMKLARVDAGSICQFSESPQSMVRLQCAWQGPYKTDIRTWVYARDAGAWRLVQKSDGVKL